MNKTPRKGFKIHQSRNILYAIIPSISLIATFALITLGISLLAN